ncbi:MAG: 3-hydroxyacyl-[acyl-carrier-protein] dehydratase FabZ, partial [Candidatus Electrothrix sp. AR1]|nr:3-hydroxyacyl-[acyl-carrier-protein] dehydratase FabZ [Candidatus Electrothrix sp. AR1]
MSEDNKVQLPMGIKEILELLPHRYPFIMLDRVLE